MHKLLYGFFLCITLFLIGTKNYAQEQFQKRRVCIKEASSAILLDGAMNEVAWLDAEIAQDFWQTFPYDTSLSEAITEIRLTYDKNFLYILAKCYNTGGTNYVTPSLRRDFRGGGNDLISFVLDPFQDQTTALIFGVNPFGVQREGIIANGGGNREDFTLDWENKWYAEAKIYDEYWIAEVAIPFKTLRYKEGAEKWLVNFFRIDSHLNERSNWSLVPRNFPLYNLAYTGELHWDKPLKKPGANVSVIPYVAGDMNKNYLEDGTVQKHLNVGGDAKVSITPSLNLDLTVNPDFSQVEVDEQVTNLERFEIFFPEKRQFFLENADLFANFGLEKTRPFFSRRIGVAIDTATGQNVQNKIWFGARLSGKLNKDWRVGLMNMQAAKDDDIGLPAYNYTVAAVQRRIFKRSNIAAIMVNKQSFAKSEGEGILSATDDYNRLVGLDYNLASADNKWNGKVFYHHLFTPGNEKETFAHGASFLFSTLHWEARWEHEIVGENYVPEVGFTPRRNYRRVAPKVACSFYPLSNWLNQHGPGIEQQWWWNDEKGLTEYNLKAFYKFTFANNSELELSLLHDYVYLLQKFNPTRTEHEDLIFQPGEDFSMSSGQMMYKSDTRNPFFYEVTATGGQFYGGQIGQVKGVLNYRYQPYGVFSLNFNYSRVMLSEPYPTTDIFLFGPRLDFTFTRSIFFTTFIQYNSQFDNININSRLQWRFKPVSDIFLVYTDNYFYDFEHPANNFNPKNRALVLKLTYWLNM